MRNFIVRAFVEEYIAVYEVQAESAESAMAIVNQHPEAQFATIAFEAEA